jgi:streptogramin lyase
MAIRCRVEDAGVMSRANKWSCWRIVRDPRSGNELALGLAQHGGFVLVDPPSGTSRIIGQEKMLPNAWAVTQAPDGAIYTAGVAGARHARLLRWAWEGDISTVAVETPGCESLFTIDAAPDNRVYLPDYKTNSLHRFDPAANWFERLCDFNSFGLHIRNLCCAADGFVYMTCTDFKQTLAVGFDPSTGRRFVVTDPGGEPINGGSLTRDAAGRVLVSKPRWGRSYWSELRGGNPVDLAPRDVALNGKNEPLVFRDGGYIAEVLERQITYVDANGRSSTFDVAWPEEPLRLFAVAAGGGKIWGSTLIPLTIISYDPATDVRTAYGNPTSTSGEIYSMLFTSGKLFMAAYYGAHLARFDPARPWKMDNSVRSNPASLGQMKTSPPVLQRPYGKALDAAGRVFFSALGGYGCEDSGLSRIDPQSEEVTSWIYPATTFGPICYLPGRDRILAGETRKGESGIRFSFISPHTGEMEESAIVIEGEGMVTSWLHEGGDLVYGLHNSRATVFAYSLSARRIVARLEDLGFGHHCYECLVAGPDGRLFGLTRECVFAVDRELKTKERVADYPDHATGNFYRFGLAQGPDGCWYFPNGPRLMRIVFD